MKIQRGIQKEVGLWRYRNTELVANVTLSVKNLDNKVVCNISAEVRIIGGIKEANNGNIVEF